MNEGRFIAAAIAAVAGTIVVHVALGFGLGRLDSSVQPLHFPAPFRWEAPARLRARSAHGAVAYERRKFTEECDSIPECHKNMEAVVVEIKLAKLGTIEQDPKKLPEIQKYEEPEKIEEAVNLDKEPVEVKPLPLQDFLKKKAELDKRFKKPRKKIDNLFNVDPDDPRANPTAFEKIVGRLDGDVYGKGSDQQKFDTYFGRCSLELHKQFHLPSSLSRADILKQRVDVLITKMDSSGQILAYRVKTPASNKSFTLAAQAAIQAFAPGEGGRFRLPEPDTYILDFVNTKGIIIALDGRLFQ